MSITLQLKATLVSVFFARSTNLQALLGGLELYNIGIFYSTAFIILDRFFSVFGFSFVSSFLNASMGSSSMLADDLNIIYSGQAHILRVGYSYVFESLGQGGSKPRLMSWQAVGTAAC